METTGKMPEIPEQNKRRTFRKVRENQLIFIEYSRPKINGHKFTVTDSYRNIISRVHERYDEQSGKFEYTAYDTEGNLMFKSPNVDLMKQELQSRKEVLFQEAYAKRLQKIREQREQGKTTDRAKTIGQKPQQNRAQQMTREEELKYLRARKSQEQSRDLGR